MIQFKLSEDLISFVLINLFQSNRSWAHRELLCLLQFLVFLSVIWGIGISKIEEVQLW